MSIGSLLGTYDRGWKLVRLFGVREPEVCTCVKGKSCGTPGKHPAGGDGWQLRATSDEDEILSWFEGGLPVNVGVLLGPASGVIDVELDGPEAAASWSRLDLGEIYTPTYVAGRGPHRLFRWDESLPPIQVKKVQGIEFRFGNGGRASQSVIPPSTHRTGKSYQWYPGLSPQEVELAPIPEKLITLLWNDDGNAIQGGSGRRPARMLLHDPVQYGGDGPGRNNELHRFAVREAFRSGPDIDRPQEQQDLLAKMRAINATMCKPSLPDDEVVAVVRSAISFARKTHIACQDPQSAMEVANLAERQEDAPEPEAGAAEGDATSGDDTASAVPGKKGKRAAPRKTCEAFTASGLSFAPLTPGSDSEPEWGPGEWKLTIVHSDPLEYRLHVPAWKQYTTNRSGNVSLTVDQYRSATKVAAAVLAATGKIMLDAEPKAWYGIWDGGLKVQDYATSKNPRSRRTQGVKAKLLETAEEEWPGASSLRYVVLAGWLHDRLMQASQPTDEDIPDPTGRAAWRHDGTLWFIWGKVWEDIERNHKVTEGERLALKRRLLGALGIQDFRHGRFRHLGDARKNYVVWTRHELAELESLAIDGAGED